MADALEEKIDRLLAIDDIALLKARYFRFMDEKNWESLRELFVDDLDFHHPTIGTFGTADETVSAVGERVATVGSVHHGHNPEITVDGDTAEGRWALHSFVFFPDADTPGITRFARYRDEFRRIDGVWKISKVHFTYDYDGAQQS